MKYFLISISETFSMLTILIDASLISTLLLSGALIPLIIFLCKRKKSSDLAQPQRDNKSTAKMKSQCNVQSGLLPDDADLKSNAHLKPAGTPTSSPPPPPTPDQNQDDPQSTDLASNLFPGGFKHPRTVHEIDAKTGIPAETKREGSKTMIQGQFIPNKSQFVNENKNAGAATPQQAHTPQAHSPLPEAATQMGGTTQVGDALHTADQA